MLSDDAQRGINVKGSTLSHLLRGEEGIENALLHVRRNAGAIVADFHDGAIQLVKRANPELAFAVHGVNGIINEIGPHLIELAAVGTDARELRIVIADHCDAIFRRLPKISSVFSRSSWRFIS